MAHPHAEIDALLFGFFDLRFARPHRAAFLHEGRNIRPVFGDRLGQRMVGRQRQEARAVQRIRPGRIDLDRVALMARLAFRSAHQEVWRLSDRPPDPRAFAAPDPVRLHDANLFRPA